MSRPVLISVGVLAVALALSGASVASAPAIFTHGVASGDVTHQSAVLWTRVDGDAGLTVEVARDPGFAEHVLTRKAQASGDTDFTAKVEVDGLQAGTRYHYRWLAGASVSEVGTFETAPWPDRSAPAHFAWTGDSDGTRIGGVPAFNNFETLDAVRSERPDFFVYLGDTIYSDFRAGGLAPSTQTLEGYRAAYKENRTYPALTRLLAATSTYAQWDDHEVTDNWDGATVDPVMYADGRRAFLEYLPVAEPNGQGQGCAGDPLFRSFSWGKDIDLIVPDERSCRSADAEAACAGDLAPTLPPFIRALFGPFLPRPVPPGCLETIDDPSRTVLGAGQKRMLENALLHSKARFKFVLSELVISQDFALPYDRWEGYAAERREILEFIRDHGIENVIFLTTDEHRNQISPVLIDRFTDPETVAWEFVTGPIATATQKRLILGAFGPVIGPLAVGAFQQILSLAGTECRNFDTYSYGSVDVDPDAGTVSIALKDSTGAPVHDDLNPARVCSKTFGP